MNSAELEAAADKHAFPWSCIKCEKTFHYAKRWRVKMAWGYLCLDCLPTEESTSGFMPKASSEIMGVNK